MEESCPVCKSDYYLNPSMQLLVSPCYHKICETCVTRLYAHGSTPCPVCGTILRRSNFAVPTFEDLVVERECRIRKKISAIFNQRQEDFEDLKAYNDYLEEVEDLVFNLVNNVNVQETDAKLEAYRLQNAELISRNQAKLMEDERTLRQELEEERRWREKIHEEALKELEEEEASRAKQKTDLIDALATSNAPATLIVATAAKKLRQPSAKAVELKIAADKAPTMRGLLRSRFSDKSRDSPTLAPIDPLESVYDIPPPVAFPDIASLRPEPGAFRQPKWSASV